MNMLDKEFELLGESYIKERKNFFPVWTEGDAGFYILDYQISPHPDIIIMEDLYCIFTK